MNLYEMQHDPTGLSFAQWLNDPRGLPAKEPISLVEIRDAFHSAFGGYRLEYGSWLDGLIICVAALVRRGLRPMLPNYRTRTWEWTDRFIGEDGEDDPESVAAMVIFSWCAYGDSGGAEHLRFGTRLPDAALPGPSAYYP
ncbi:hypothetical protein [Bradyrhizobium sp. STM 3809]|uniref:hypothetical protein n=1 Tax=Bradyrhizobium sp. STM 3809 TaxID=551936 RepID=UPI001111FB24|nr:hypothetical protein [Bradyrhizobium sp. STM 3809]